MIENQPAPVEPSKDGNDDAEGLSKRGVVWFYIVQCLALGIVAFLLLQTGEYGFSLFCVIPFSVGLTAGAYTKRFRTKKLLKATATVMLVVLVASAALILAGLEGAICIVMAVGLLVLPIFVGMLIGYWIRNVHRTYIALFVVLLNSSFVTFDYVDDNGVEAVATESVTINASKEKIWHVLTHGVQFHPNTNMFFEAGVNYPTSMTLQYTSPSTCFLVCTLSAGNASLEIQRIDSLKSIRFSVPQGVQSMTELSVYDSIDAAHLKGYFNPRYGEFRIEEINAEQCRLVATTSYAYKITPAFYWEWWSDYLVNTMHRHVINDIKVLAEEK